MGLLVGFVLTAGLSVNIYWLYLPLLWGLELVFVCGCALLFSAINVYIRDTRYFVESATLVLFWLVPIFYSFSAVPQRFKDLYQYNPIAALVLAMRDIVLDAKAPSDVLMMKLTFVSILALGAGVLVFRRLKPRFFDYL
jgi:ABC-type polysaccharide/polyol phosphate export permease